MPTQIVLYLIFKERFTKKRKAFFVMADCHYRRFSACLEKLSSSSGTRILRILWSVSNVYFNFLSLPAFVSKLTVRSLALPPEADAHSTDIKTRVNCFCELFLIRKYFNNFKHLFTFGTLYTILVSINYSRCIPMNGNAPKRTSWNRCMSSNI